MKKTLIIILLLFTIIFVLSCRKEEDIVIEDSDFYMSGDYLDDTKYNNMFYSPIISRANSFLPKYDNIGFEYDSIKFYLLCHEDKSVQSFADEPDSTIVLEFIFSNDSNYINAKDIVLSSFEFLDAPVKSIVSFVMPVASFQINDWECSVVKEKEIVYPSCNIVCYNDNAKTIRYLCYYDKDTDVINKNNFITSIINGTKCEW